MSKIGSSCSPWCRLSNALKLLLKKNENKTNHKKKEFIVLQQVCSRFAAALKQVCSRFAAALKQVCSSFEAGLQQVCSRFAAGLQQL